MPSRKATTGCAAKNNNIAKGEDKPAQFKEKVGYKEPDTVETKFEKPNSSKLDDRELEDENPTVVLGSNVTQAEANVYLSRLKAEEEAEKTEKKINIGEGDDTSKDDGKIVFKKPGKRKSKDSERQLKYKADNGKKAKPNSTMKSVKNKTLLSFDEEEDED